MSFIFVSRGEKILSCYQLVLAPFERIVLLNETVSLTGRIRVSIITYFEIIGFIIGSFFILTERKNVRPDNDRGGLVISLYSL